LFLTPQPPYPPHAGNALRTLGLLEGLHAAGITVDLLTFAEEGQPDPLTTPATTLCRRVIAIPAPHRPLRARIQTLLNGQADMSSRFWSAPYAEALKKLLSEGDSYDAIQFEGLEMACYLPLIQALRPQIKILYGAANAEFELQRLIYQNDQGQLSRLPGTVYSWVQWQRLRDYEKSVCERSTHVIATSPADADSFGALAPKTAVSVVPNGINVKDYMTTPAQIELGSAALLFTGSMGYRPNVDAMVWFANAILPLIREGVPDTRLFIVGKKPHARLDFLRGRADIEITGFVPDVTPFLHACTVYIAPLRTGSGTRLKLLQAMAAERAIVSTGIGAQGLAITSGRELILADTAAAFAQSVITLIRDQLQRVTMGKNAQQFVCDQYDWSVIIPKLLTVYRSLDIG
jgi:glycosyltransferase involved in cell wall biosynthesis